MRIGRHDVLPLLGCEVRSITECSYLGATAIGLGGALIGIAAGMFIMALVATHEPKLIVGFCGYVFAFFAVTGGAFVYAGIRTLGEVRRTFSRAQSETATVKDA